MLPLCIIAGYPRCPPTHNLRLNIPEKEIVLAAMPLSAELRRATPSLRIAIHPQFEAFHSIRIRKGEVANVSGLPHDLDFFDFCDCEAQHLRDRVQESCIRIIQSVLAAFWASVPICKFC